MKHLKFKMRAAVLILVVLVGLSIQGVSENDVIGAQDEEEAETSEITTNEEAMIDDAGKPNENKPGTETLLLIIFMLSAIPVLIVGGNVWGAYTYYGDRQKELKELLDRKNIGEKETAQLIKEYTSMKPVGLEGVARAAMAISIIVILGIAVIFLLIYPPDKEPPMVKDVLLILSGAISSIVGFYFGGRTGQEGATPSASTETESATQQQTATKPATNNKPNVITGQEGEATPESAEQKPPEGEKPPGPKG